MWICPALLDQISILFCFTENSFKKILFFMFFCNTIFSPYPPPHWMPLQFLWCLDYSNAALHLIVAGLCMLSVLRLQAHLFLPLNNNRMQEQDKSLSQKLQKQNCWKRSRGPLHGKIFPVVHMNFTVSLLPWETNLCLSQWQEVIFKAPRHLRIVALCILCWRLECQTNKIILLEKCWIKGSS